MHLDLPLLLLGSLSLAISTMAKYTTLLMDMDGVLAEVSKSYRAATIATCHQYGATSVNEAMVVDYKARGNANDDWQLSHRLIRENGGDQTVTLEQVTQTFEDFYQGTATTEGLCKLETLIPSRETLNELKRRSGKVGIVTGRPKSDCLKFLRDFDLVEMVDAMYCMEDGPSKPSPVPVQTCCKLIGVKCGPSVVLVGDTPDDIRAAVNAECKAVGVVTPECVNECSADGSDPMESKMAMAMKEAGADMILLPGFDELVNLFAEP